MDDDDDVDLESKLPSDSKGYNYKLEAGDTATFEEVYAPGAIKIKPLKDNELIDISNDFSDFAKLSFGIKKLNSTQSQQHVHFQ